MFPPPHPAATATNNPSCGDQQILIQAISGTPCDNPIACQFIPLLEIITLFVPLPATAKANEAIENPHRAQKTLASQSVNGVIAGLGQSKLSFREFVEATASSAGFGLVPTRLRGGVSLAVDSTHVFLLGDAGQGIIVQLDRGVVFVQDDQGWTPMSVDSAIESARSKRAKSLQREKH